jgi:hypothetical protein
MFVVHYERSTQLVYHIFGVKDRMFTHAKEQAANSAYVRRLHEFAKSQKERRHHDDEEDHLVEAGGGQRIGMQSAEEATVAA